MSPRATWAPAPRAGVKETLVELVENMRAEPQTLLDRVGTELSVAGLLRELTGEDLLEPMRPLETKTNIESELIVFTSGIGLERN